MEIDNHCKCCGALLCMSIILLSGLFLVYFSREGDYKLF